VISERINQIDEQENHIGIKKLRAEGQNRKKN
jgi:hypothetical protein